MIFDIPKRIAMQNKHITSQSKGLLEAVTTANVLIGGCNNQKKANHNCKHKISDGFCNRRKIVCPGTTFSNILINHTI